VWKALVHGLIRFARVCALPLLALVLLLLLLLLVLVQSFPCNNEYKKPNDLRTLSTYEVSGEGSTG